MKTKRLSLVVLAAAMSLAARAAAPEQEPGVESEAPPAEEAQPPGDAAAAPADPAAVAPPAAVLPSGADTVFGSAGQITISDDLQLSAIRESISGSAEELTNIQLRPAVDFFLVPNLSLGGQLIIGHQSREDSTFAIDTSSTELGLLARLGYNFAISPTTSIWPRISLGYVHLSQTPYAGSQERTGNTVPLQVDVLLVFQPVPHFFIGGGPLVRRTLYAEMDDMSAPTASAIGLQSTLGGYFHGF